MLPMPEILLDTQCRFWEKVDVKSDSECWNWNAGVVSSGYGVICIKYLNYCAHRISYYIHYKKDPGELLVCHECNNKLCVNPQHLFLGTQQDNVQHAFDTGIVIHKGNLHPNARFRDSHSHEIRKLADTMSQGKIAKLFNVSPSAIWQILTRKTWSHVI